MYKSISVWAFDPGRPLAEVFTMARNAGFDGIELAIAEDGPITPQSSDSELRAIAELADAAELRLSGLASGLGWRYPLTSTNPQTANRAKELIACSLSTAQTLGIDAILVAPGGVAASFIPNFDGSPYDIAFDNALAGLIELKSLAEETQVSIGVENVWNMFLLSPLEMRDLIDRVDSEYVGSYFDVGNVILTGFAEQWIDILGTRIKRVHLKDFRQAVGTLAGFCDLLEGDVDYPAVMVSLRRVGYAGPLTAEYFNCEDKLELISSTMDTIMAM